MEFDNISRDYKLDSFSQNLPTYIINNFSNLEYLNILYAPKIIPSIYYYACSSYQKNYQDKAIRNFSKPCI